jgi:hypothetical protein
VNPKEQQRNFWFGIVISTIFFPLTAYILIGKICLKFIELLDWLTITLHNYYLKYPNWENLRLTDSNNSNSGNESELWYTLLFPFVSIAIILGYVLPRFIFIFLICELIFFFKTTRAILQTLNYCLLLTGFTASFITITVWNTVNNRNMETPVFNRPFYLSDNFNYIDFSMVVCNFAGIYHVAPRLSLIIDGILSLARKIFGLN